MDVRCRVIVLILTLRRSVISFVHRLVLKIIAGVVLMQTAALCQTRACHGLTKLNMTTGVIRVIAAVQQRVRPAKKSASKNGMDAPMEAIAHRHGTRERMVRNASQHAG